MGERCTVEGTVQSVIFQNEENGYTVLSLAVDGQEEPVTVVGCIPCAAAGEGMTVTGVWVEHPSYGPQLTAESVERRLPRDEADMAAYLGSGILKGVGPATAERLVDAGNTVLVIEHNLDVIKCADYIVDLGPEGGSGGGTVVACGTPEQVADVAASYTGQYLKKYLT